ncbi:hypothetical protein O6H91_07G004300 [Diphasiastrum complanatum]|uniref:Uncharacterized protein n=1 Tax=Diphasiastrum complanatum TaxID=34168 RepID=A0ACC2D1V4_DIPCM|nr:hypothetical protein O6H91_07G004300 [Diphasiastrum complanatum]
MCKTMGKGQVLQKAIMLLCLFLLTMKVNGDTDTDTDTDTFTTSKTTSYKPGEPKQKHCKADSYSDDGWWSHCKGIIKCPAYCPECHLSCKFCGMSYCPKCNKVGSICQDPRFIGGDGVMFYFHGSKDADYCIVSDTNLHINAHFIGRRPAGRPRDFTWVQSLGILFDTHKLYVGARQTATWNPTSDRFLIYLDGKSVQIPQAKGANWALDHPQKVKFTRLEAANSINVLVEGVLNATIAIVPITREESRAHKYEIPADDCFAHLEVSLEFPQVSERVSGVLGQTYRPQWETPIKHNVPMPTMGGEDKYVASAILTPDCPVSQFRGVRLPASLALSKNSGAMPSVKCGDGPDGFGFACKK